MSKKPTLFISYSWSTKEIVNKISTDLQLVGVDVIKDNQELEYTDSIPTFMKRIRLSNFALLFVSDGYLKSKNCLFEILELQKDEDHWNKVLPIVSKNTKIYEAIDRLKYVKYWEEKTEELETELKGLNPINLTESYKELKLFKDITASIDDFLKNISEAIHFSPEEVIEKNYEPIMNKLGADYEPKSLIKLLNIVLINNLENREIALEDYLKKYPESSYYYSIKAGTSRDLKKYEQAIYYYKKGLNLDGTNYEILNNLGRVLEDINKDYDGAKECYEKAILANPNFDVPRLNLGCLLSQHFNDDKGAEEQYKAILEFEPNNAKAHNNLGNIFKKPGNEEYLNQSEKHLLKAIEIDPNYIEPLFNYGNFLKAYRKDIDGGNEYYKRAKEINTDEEFGKIIDYMLKSVKG